MLAEWPRPKEIDQRRLKDRLISHELKSRDGEDHRKEEDERMPRGTFALRHSMRCQRAACPMPVVERPRDCIVCVGTSSRAASGAGRRPPLGGACGRARSSSGYAAMGSQCEIRSRVAPLACTVSTGAVHRWTWTDAPGPRAPVGAVRPHALWAFNVDASPQLVLAIDRSARGSALRSGSRPACAGRWAACLTRAHPISNRNLELGCLMQSWPWHGRLTLMIMVEA